MIASAPAAPSRAERVVKPRRGRGKSRTVTCMGGMVVTAQLFGNCGENLPTAAILGVSFVTVALDFTTLVDEHGDYLFRVALRHFPERHRAEELVQETFVAALEAASRFQGHASPRTWLTSILRHKIIDAIRRKVREEPPRLEASESLDQYFERKAHWKPGAEPQPWQTSPETLPSQKEFFGVLRNCLTTIPETQRQVFVLREIDELDPEEICNTMSLSATNVRVLLHRARLALRKCLEANWFGKVADGRSNSSFKRGAT